MTFAAAALGLGAGLVGWRAAVAPTAQNATVVLAVGGCALALLAVGLAVGATDANFWGLAGLAVVYGVGIPVHAGSPGQAAGYGLALFATGELAYLGYEQTTRVTGEPGTLRGRVTLLLGVAATALAVDAAATGSAGLPGGGLGLLAIGVAALVLLLAGVAALVGRRRPG